MSSALPNDPVSGRQAILNISKDIKGGPRDCGLHSSHPFPPAPWRASGTCVTALHTSNPRCSLTQLFFGHLLGLEILTLSLGNRSREGGWICPPSGRWHFDQGIWSLMYLEHGLDRRDTMAMSGRPCIQGPLHCSSHRRALRTMRPEAGTGMHPQRTARDRSYHYVGFPYTFN